MTTPVSCGSGIFHVFLTQLRTMWEVVSQHQIEIQSLYLQTAQKMLQT